MTVPQDAQLPTRARQIVSAFDPVVGLKLSISRYSGLKNFQFGEIRPHQGGTVGQWALHIQCPWRIVAADRIVAGSADSSEATELFPQYDPLTKSYLNVSDQLVVEQVHADDHGGVDIQLSGGYRLQVFPDAKEGESWRLFEPAKTTPHFVIEQESPSRED